jgi:hypothetical protein
MVAVTLRQLHGFAASVSEIIKLGASGPAASNRLDVDNVRRMQGKCPFHAFVRNNTPNGKGLVYATTFTGNHRAGKNLDAGLVAFLNFALHFNRIAYLKVGHLFFEAFAFYSV